MGAYSLCVFIRCACLFPVRVYSLCVLIPCGCCTNWVMMSSAHAAFHVPFAAAVSFWVAKTHCAAVAALHFCIVACVHAHMCKIVSAHYRSTLTLRSYCTRDSSLLHSWQQHIAQLIVLVTAAYCAAYCTHNSSLLHSWKQQISTKPAGFWHRVKHVLCVRACVLC